ncbi:MAG: Gfo/Idh/MocA family protein [Mycobacterium sp.]|jgi:predicted dehydrogenase|uniref:Gfo/Idh/MocA family protein n=1 Tax=Mycobacterium sp. TaxID=1785 RepID=UPI00389A7F1D
MTRPFRVGVIGANPDRGWAKDSHIPALRSLENVQLAAVATSSRASADAAAAVFGVRAAYDDPRAMVKAPDIDIVSVCVRVPYHRDLVLAALATDKHVYCEWPLGRDAGEAAEMAAAARMRPVHVAIGLQAHMNPAGRRAADLIATGAIGRPLTARIFSSTAGFAPHLSATHAYLNKIENGANLITILGGHTLDLAILVIGAIESLDALTTLQHPTVTLTDTGEQIQRTAPDHLLVQARMSSGCALAVEVAGDRPPDTPFTFEVVGTEGRILLAGGHPNGFQAGRLTLSLNGERQWVDEPPDTLPAAAVNVAAMYSALTHDISSGEHTTPDFDHAVRLTHLMDDVLQSAGSGHRLTRKDWPTSGS